MAGNSLKSKKYAIITVVFVVAHNFMSSVSISTTSIVPKIPTRHYSYDTGTIQRHARHLD